MSLRNKIEKAINECNAENASNTPDFLLAEFLLDCLTAFDKTTRARDKWYGVHLKPGQAKNSGDLEKRTTPPLELDEAEKWLCDAMKSPTFSGKYLTIIATKLNQLRASKCGYVQIIEELEQEVDKLNDVLDEYKRG